VRLRSAIALSRVLALRAALLNVFNGISVKEEV